MKQKGKALRLISENGLLIFLVALCCVVTFFEPRFLSANNLMNVLIQVAINAIIATGIIFPILTGGIDLSVGSIAALSGVIVAWVIKVVNPQSVVLSLVIILAVSALVGLVFGSITAFAVSRLNVAPFIATLAIMSVARGLAYIITDGKPIFQLANSFKWLGQARVLGIPVLVILMIIILVSAWFLLEKMPFGRYVLAVGSNEEVAYLSGVNVKRIKFTVYIISAVMAALGGVILASKLGTGQPAAGEGYEMTAIAAIVMGGTSLSGGRGSIGKTIIGILTIGVINNGLNLLQVSSYWQTVTMGVIILVAVILDQFRGSHN